MSTITQKMKKLKGATEEAKLGGSNEMQCSQALQKLTSIQEELIY